jgi:hypothetical protein
MNQLAQKVTNPALGSTLENILSSEGGVGYLGRIIPTFITIGLVVGVLYFVYHLLMGAIHWIISGGDKSKLQGAKDQLTNAFIGLFILFSLFAIITLIERIFAIDLLSIDLSVLFIE